MKNPCSHCSFDESRCILHGHCRQEREFKEASAAKRRESEYLRYRHDRKTAAMHAAKISAHRQIYGEARA
jgi:hypothetical protein